MSADCCDNKQNELEHLRGTHARVLKLVLFVNLSMFFVEFTAGWIARSTALLGDSLDMLGDAIVYGMSLYVVARGAASKARVALLKGALMILLGLIVLFEAINRVLTDSFPEPQTMGLIAFMALAANAYCVWLLFKHREDDLNMRSVWICSRNDIVANVSVMIAAGLVTWMNSKWPDVLVGSAIACLFLKSGVGVFTESFRVLRQRTF